MTLLRFFIEETPPILDIKDREVLAHISARRFAQGDEIIICNREGKTYRYKITKRKKGSVTVERVEEIDTFKPQRRIAYAQSILKPRKLDLIITLGTQLGVEEFVFFISKRSSVTDIEIIEKRIERLRHLAVTSASISLDKVPEIKVLENLLSVLNMFPQSKPFMLYENAIERLDLGWLGKNNIKDILLIIGPEGGFDGEEVQMVRENGGFIFSLGERILTSEAAGLVALSLIQFGI
ncbi:MAG: RsmE family RNA methyltransferase [bacterium]